jgi:hypothetical protein
LTQGFSKDADDALDRERQRLANEAATTTEHIEESARALARKDSPEVRERHVIEAIRQGKTTNGWPISNWLIATGGGGMIGVLLDEIATADFRVALVLTAAIAGVGLAIHVYKRIVTR